MADRNVEHNTQIFKFECVVHSFKGRLMQDWVYRLGSCSCKLIKILRLLQKFFYLILILSGDHLLVNGVAGDLQPAPKKNIIPKTKNFLWVYTKRADWGLTTNKLKNKNQWKISHWKCVVIFWISVKPYPERKWKGMPT